VSSFGPGRKGEAESAPATRPVVTAASIEEYGVSMKLTLARSTPLLTSQAASDQVRAVVQRNDADRLALKIVGAADWRVFGDHHPRERCGTVPDGDAGKEPQGNAVQCGARDERRRRLSDVERRARSKSPNSCA
jgi:hypothetical protein